MCSPTYLPAHPARGLSLYFQNIVVFLTSQHCVHFLYYLRPVSGMYFTLLSAIPAPCLQR